MLYLFSEDEGSVHTSSVSSEHSDDVESQTASTNKVCISHKDHRFRIHIEQIGNSLGVVNYSDRIEINKYQLSTSIYYHQFSYIIHNVCIEACTMYTKDY